MSERNRRPDQTRGASNGGPGGRDAPPGAQRPAERVMHDAPADRPVYRDGPGNERAGPNGIPDSRPYEDAETALGGADAVEKTSYGSPLGAEPGGLRENTDIRQRKGQGTVTARVGTGGGIGPVAWIAIALAVIAAIVYASGLFG